MTVISGWIFRIQQVARKRIYLVLETSISKKDTKVDKNTPITATFNNDLDETAINQNSIILTKEGSTDPIQGDIKVDPKNKK